MYRIDETKMSMETATGAVAAAASSSSNSATKSSNGEKIEALQYELSEKFEHLATTNAAAAAAAAAAASADDFTMVDDEVTSSPATTSTTTLLNDTQVLRHAMQLLMVETDRAVLLEKFLWLLLQYSGASRGRLAAPIPDTDEEQQRSSLTSLAVSSDEWRIVVSGSVTAGDETNASAAGAKWLREHLAQNSSSSITTPTLRPIQITSAQLDVPQPSLSYSIPLSVFNYVVSSRAPLTLHEHDLTEIPFSRDSYFTNTTTAAASAGATSVASPTLSPSLAPFLTPREPIKSCLGVPIINQDSNILYGIIYLENDVSSSPTGAPSTFTSHRLEQITFLCHQLVSQLDHAREFNEATELREEAESNLEKKSIFLMNLSNGLSQPLREIVSQAKVLKDQTAVSGSTVSTPSSSLLSPPSPASSSSSAFSFSTFSEVLDRIHSSASLLLTSSTDIFNLSSLDTNSFQLHTSSFSLYECIERSIASCWENAYRHGIDLYYHMSYDLPESIIGDQKRIIQLLYHILYHSIQSTRDNRGSICLKVTQCNRRDLLTSSTGSKTQQQIELQFEIRDTGAGLSPEAVRQVFQPFEQPIDSKHTNNGASEQNLLSSPTSAAATGVAAGSSASSMRQLSENSLGLVISKKLVDRMGGRLWLTSVEGVGNTFHIRLPCHASDIGQSAPSVSSSINCPTYLRPYFDATISQTLTNMPLFLIGQKERHDSLTILHKMCQSVGLCVRVWSGHEEFHRWLHDMHAHRRFSGGDDELALLLPPCILFDAPDLQHAHATLHALTRLAHPFQGLIALTPPLAAMPDAPSTTKPHSPTPPVHPSSSSNQQARKRTKADDGSVVPPSISHPLPPVPPSLPPLPLPANPRFHELQHPCRFVDILHTIAHVFEPSLMRPTSVRSSRRGRPGASSSSAQPAPAPAPRPQGATMASINFLRQQVAEEQKSYQAAEEMMNQANNVISPTSAQNSRKRNAGDALDNESSSSPPPSAAAAAAASSSSLASASNNPLMAVAAHHQDIASSFANGQFTLTFTNPTSAASSTIATIAPFSMTDSTSVPMTYQQTG